MTIAPRLSATTPVWFWAAAGAGLVWNLYGVYQFIRSVGASEASLIAMGLTTEQAQVMSSYPAWMTVAFAVGVFGGLIGCVLLLLRNKAALPVFAVSLAGYVALYIGDITQGVFAAMGAGQVIILTLVVAIAAGLFWLARHTTKSGLLT